METFNFPFHTVRYKYPASSVVVQFGRSWTFTAEPEAPDQRVFTLKFKAMRWYIGVDGFPEATTDPTRNVKTLDNFYQAQRLFKEFQYPNPVFGTMVVRFNKPLEVPEAIEGGSGEVPDIEIELVEVPL